MAVVDGDGDSDCLGTAGGDDGDDILFRVCSGFVQGFSGFVHRMFTICSPYVHHVFRVCSPYICTHSYVNICELVF